MDVDSAHCLKSAGCGPPRIPPMEGEGARVSPSWRAESRRRPAGLSCAPDIGDRRGEGRLAKRWETVHREDGSQHAVVVDAFVVVTGHDAVADEYRGDPVLVLSVVLVESHDQQTVVAATPI